ncbi:hypothetical protein [Streptomyces spectabilis]|uniref:PQQ-binding-like beta-propeller repeat protein n=1 Tax=Streptomyces spectabilis TaxID=68270 RepID=A0A516RDB6_STRST|nr:hypothetical protein [Streptomyces spectabilis]QDQ13649.1 hypothetical protein FH965_26390 [Streptomyces spectabilis]
MLVLSGCGGDDGMAGVGGAAEISGYPLAGGKAAWEVPWAGEICRSSPTPTKDGKVAVVFQNDKKDPSVCTEVGVVDIEQGKLLWRKQGVDASGTSAMFDEVTIGGGTVAAAGTGASAGWKLDGTPLWKPSDEPCDTVGHAGDETRLVAVRDCGDTDSPRPKVETVDPGTRAVKSTFALPHGTAYVHVVSVDPLVLAAEHGEHSETGARFESDRRLLSAGGRRYPGAGHVTEPSTVDKTP